jgi:hypothetical protein
MDRESKYEHKQRVNDAIQKLMDFDSYGEIRRYLTVKYNIKERQAERDIADARKKIASEPVPDIESVRNVITARLQGVCKKAALQNKLDTEIRGIKLLSEIHGLLNAENKPVDNGQPNTDPTEWVTNAQAALATGGFEVPTGEPATDLDSDDGPTT